jgi:hypothetical protein
MPSPTPLTIPAGLAPGRPKRARVPSGDRPAYPTDEGHP